MHAERARYRTLTAIPRLPPPGNPPRAAALHAQGAHRMGDEDREPGKVVIAALRSLAAIVWTSVLLLLPRARFRALYVVCVRTRGGRRRRAACDTSLTRLRLAAPTRPPGTSSANVTRAHARTRARTQARRSVYVQLMIASVSAVSLWLSVSIHGNLLAAAGTLPTYILFIHTYIHTYIHACIHTYAHTNTHTHTDT